MRPSIMKATKADAKHVDTVIRWGGNWQHWDVRLNYKDQQINVDFYTKSKIEKPTVEQVIYSLVADDQTLMISSTFEDWCVELGYNPDSISDRATYDLCIKNSLNVRRLYGDDFTAAQLEVEDL